MGWKENKLQQKTKEQVWSWRQTRTFNFGFSALSPLSPEPNLYCSMRREAKRTLRLEGCPVSIWLNFQVQSTKQGLRSNRSWGSGSMQAASWRLLQIYYIHFTYLIHHHMHKSMCNIKKIFKHEIHRQQKISSCCFQLLDCYLDGPDGSDVRTIFE